MGNSIAIGLIQNIALLLSFTLIYDFFWARGDEIKRTSGKILAGILIGAIAIFVMYVPVILQPGLIFDSRSILLAISGLFFGMIPTLIAMTMAIVYRILLGGDGVWMGVAVILSSGFIGMAWGIFFPPRKIKMPQYNILFLGLIVHIIMFLCIFLLPRASVATTMRYLFLPLILIYIPGTMLLGVLMLQRWSIWQQQKTKEEDELRYRMLFENAGEAILVAERGYIRFANNQLAELLEIPYEEIFQKKFTEFIHPDDREFVLSRHVDRSNKLNVPRHYSFRVITPSKDIKWVDINSVAIDWNGKPGSLSFLNDVTVQREHARQLVVAKNKAEESDKLKTIFLTNMSHEVRTPMNAILGFSDLLSDSSLSHEKQQYYIDMIQAAGKKLLHIINDIVDTSKLEIHQLQINKQVCNIHDIYNQSIEMFLNNPLFKEKTDIKFKISMPENFSDFQILADPYRIQQVVDNFLSNAVKYTQQGIIELTCEIKDEKDHIIMKTSVRDTGSGIPENKRGIIFERFRQVEEDQYREGTGLGLSISKGIIDLMGGKIGYESIVGEGSTFYFTLMLEKAHTEDRSIRTKDSVIPDLEGMHVMIAEDDLTSYHLMREYLLDTGARISYALDGEELMKKLETEQPDLLMLDINMPKKDGYACLEEIREKNYQFKIIAQTAYAMENEKEKCLNSGCQGYVAKPIDQEILYRSIKQVFEKK